MSSRRVRRYPLLALWHTQLRCFERASHQPAHDRHTYLYTARQASWYSSSRSTDADSCSSRRGGHRPHAERSSYLFPSDHNSPLAARSLVQSPTHHSQDHIYALSWPTCDGTLVRLDPHAVSYSPALLPSARAQQGVRVFPTDCTGSQGTFSSS